MNRGQKLLKKAKKIIPGGNQLLSKRSEMFLPDLWPTYYKSSNGCTVIDLNNKKYYDFAGMGVTSCILGYADKDVNKAVNYGLTKGSMSTLNCPEEVQLAERLLELHPWADMVRFARSGGEANAISIRIARAAVGKDKVAFCGYHGWHDWYLAANLKSKNKLSYHLLPGITPKGVPKYLKDTIIPFRFNSIEDLKNIVEKNAKNCAAIVLEPARETFPDKNFLKKIRRIASKNNTVLIFDEITSGWRMTIGGIHKLFGINPDLVIYGKR